MQIRQFEDSQLAHFSYAILSDGEIALIDPSRDPQPYIDFAIQEKAVIKAVIETHPHADFVSSHLELHNRLGADILVSRLVGAEYPHLTFDNGDSLHIGRVELKAMNTPGHSPDSISILVVDEQGKDSAIFTGDTLFIGDCGRPDLRENAGAITAARTELAGQMYDSLRNVIMKLHDDISVYPAHGAGSLCGKGLRNASRSTIGEEKQTNWSLQEMSREQFIQELLSDQPFIPKYFTFNVSLNKKGAPHFEESISQVPRDTDLEDGKNEKLQLKGMTIIDTRPQDQFIQGHHEHAINLMNDNKFETWLGSIVEPGEPIYLIAENEESLDQIIRRVAKIGYEQQITAATVINSGNKTMERLDTADFRRNTHAFTIVDIRNDSEVRTQQIFSRSIHIPLHELRDRVGEIPLGKPIVVHCAGGYRSAAGSTIIKSGLNGTATVFDLSTEVKTFYR
jgi:glyoxylase-like metal-dependent hydrolase (beta-lactamase superfamily II)